MERKELQTIINIIYWQVEEFIDTKRKSTLADEDLCPMVSVRLGELNRRCKNKGIDKLDQSEVRKAIENFGIGK